MRVLVIGAGMYVTGRDGTGVGTILSSLAESSRTIEIEKVTVVARSESNRVTVDEATNRINSTLRTKLIVDYEALGENSAENLKQLCDKENYTCGIVCVPDHLHFEYTWILLNCNIHVLVVKPLTPTLGEAIKLVKLQQQKNLYAAVEFHKRYDEANLYVKKAISEGFLGKLLYFTVDFSQRIEIPTKVFREWSDRTNSFQYLGVHYVDLVNFLTGYQPYRAMAVGTRGKLMEMGIQTYDSVNATILWKASDTGEELVSQFATNWVDPNSTSAMSDQKYKLVGTAGRLECDQKNRGLEVVSQDHGIKTINPYFAEYLADMSGETVFTGYGHKSIVTFIKDVEEIQAGKRDPTSLEGIRPTFASSLISTAVVDAVNQSLSGNSEWREIDDNLGK